MRLDLTSAPYLFILRRVIAGLAAIQAIIIAILHQADVVFALAKHTKVLAIALAPLFRLVALHANVGVGHTANSIAKLAGRKARFHTADDC